MKDYYYILGIKKEDSLDEVKKAYRKLSMKFHPDKNDGDEFYADRFKEIQEAYETLSDSQKRKVYDDKITTNQNNGFNFNPVVEYFRANKSSFEFDEEVTFSWKTINSDRVTINLFGIVQPIGRKTFRIKSFKHAELKIELLAENTNINKQIKYSLKLNNRTYEELYIYFKQLIINENTTKGKRDSLYTQTVLRETIGNRTLEIVSTNYETIGAKVYINNKVADDGVYIYKSFTHKLRIKNGIIIERFYLEKKGDYIFEKVNKSEPAIGDKVYTINWKSVPNGNYRYSFFKSYIVENGKIIK